MTLCLVSIIFKRWILRGNRKESFLFFNLYMGNEDSDGNQGNSSGTGVVLESKPRTKKPSMYKVVMLNDDYTPMEFVVMVLERVFAKANEEAIKIMLHVHQKGVGICGVYTFEVAETKVGQVMELAKEHQHPLQCTLEKE